MAEETMGQRHTLLMFLGHLNGIRSYHSVMSANRDTSTPHSTGPETSCRAAASAEIDSTRHRYGLRCGSITVSLRYQLPH